jgi:hypothetical protein
MASGGLPMRTVLTIFTLGLGIAGALAQTPAPIQPKPATPAPAQAPAAQAKCVPLGGVCGTTSDRGTRTPACCSGKCPPHGFYTMESPLCAVGNANNCKCQ